MSALAQRRADAAPAGIDKTVVKSLAMLEHLVDLGRPSGVTELALASSLQKSNVHRILSTLRFMGYVRSNADSSYEPTLRLWELGQRIHGRMDIAAAARAASRIRRSFRAASARRPLIGVEVALMASAYHWNEPFRSN